MHYQFDNFQLHTETHKIFRDQELISEDHRVILLLQILVENYPSIVSKQELINRLWPKSDVTEWALSRLIADTRQLLNDTGKEQKYLKTIHGRGYKLNVQPIVRTGENLKNTRNQYTSRRFGALITGLIVIVTTIFILQHWLPDQAVTASTSSISGIRVAVLPVQNHSKNANNEWIKYGLMSFISEQIGYGDGIESVSAFDVLETLESFDINKNPPDEITRKHFDLVCTRLACTHLISSRFESRSAGLVLTYTIHTDKGIYKKNSFQAENIISAAKAMLADPDIMLSRTRHITLNPENVFTDDNIANRNYVIGKSELLAANLNSAATFFELAINREPQFYSAIADLAYVKIRQGQYQQATQHIEKLEFNAKTVKQIYIAKKLKSDLLIYENRYEEAIPILEELISYWDESGSWLKLADSLNNLGIAYSRSGSHEKALGFYKKSLDISNKIAANSVGSKSYLFMGYSWLFLEEQHLALESFLKSQELAQKSLDYRRLLTARSAIADIRIDLGDLNGIEEELDNLLDEYKKIDAAPNIYSTLIVKAKYRFLSGDLSKAKTEILDVIQQLDNLEYGNLKAWANSLAVRIFIKSGEFALAKSYFQSLPQDEPTDTRSHIILLEAELAIGLKEYSRAVTVIEQKKALLDARWTDKHQKVSEGLLARIPGDHI